MPQFVAKLYQVNRQRELVTIGDFTTTIEMPLSADAVEAAKACADKFIPKAALENQDLWLQLTLGNETVAARVWNPAKREWTSNG